MPFRTAGKSRAGASRRFVAIAGLVAEAHDPGVVHEKEVEDRTKEGGVRRAARKPVRPRARRAQEDRQQFLVPGEPSKRAERERFSGVLRNGHIVPAPF